MYYCITIAQYGPKINFDITCVFDITKFYSTKSQHYVAKQGNNNYPLGMPFTNYYSYKTIRNVTSSSSPV